MVSNRLSLQLCSIPGTFNVRGEGRMFATICKEFTFDAAHKLPNHSGKCSQLHGHTYKVRVYLRGRVHPLDNSATEGMVEDFTHIKEVFKRRVEDFCDHKFLNETLPIAITTAEFLAGWILIVLRKELSAVIKVRVYETPTAYAEVAISDFEDSDVS